MNYCKVKLCFEDCILLKLYCREFIYHKKVTQEDIVMDKKMISMCESNKSAKECLKIQQSEDVMVRLPMESNNKIEDVFPWLSKFNNLVHSSAGSRNYQHLEQLLYLYTP